MDELKNKSYVEFKAEKELAEEANRIPVVEKELTKGERFKRSLVHFWSYKKWYVIIPAIVIIVVASLLTTYINSHKKSFFRMALVNVEVIDSSILPSENEEFMNRLKEEGIATDKDEFVLQDKYRHQLASDPEFNSNQDIAGSTQRLSVEIINGLVDVLVVNERCCDDYSENGAFVDLREVFSNEELKKINSEFIYYYEKEGQQIPVGISVKAFDEFDSLIYREGDEYVISVSSFSTNKNLAHDYVMYLLED